VAEGAVLGNAIGYVDINTSGVTTGLNQAKTEFNNFISATGSMIQGLGSQMAGFGAALTGFTLPVSIVAGVGLKAASDFDSVMTEIQARTGLTVEAMEQVRQTALQLGADTSFSTQQAADAFLNLLTAGLSVEEALATLPSVLDAAAAGNMDLASAADYTTSIMAQFGLTAQDTKLIVDALAQSSGATPASMAEMAAALNEVGSTAKMFNLDVTETSAVLAIFAENGIRGTKAGDNLKSMLLQLAESTSLYADDWAKLGTSLYDTNGNMRDLDDVLADVRVGLASLPVEEQNLIMQHLAGSVGLAGFNALLASDGIAEMTTTMEAQASASEVAQQMMASFAGQIDSLMGSIEALWITVLTPFMNNVLRPLIGTAIQVVNGIKDWAAANEPLVQTIMTVAAAVLALGPTLFGLGKFIQFIGFSLSAVGAVIGFILSPIGLLTAAVAGLAYIFRDQLWNAFQLGIKAASSFTDYMSETGDLVGSIFWSITSFIGNFALGLGVSWDAALAWQIGVNNAFESVRNTIGAFWIFVSTFVSDIQQFGIGEAIMGIFGQGNLGETMQSSLEGLLTRLGFVRSEAIRITNDAWNAFSSWYIRLRSIFFNISTVIGGFISTAKAAFSLFFGLLENGVPVLEALRVAIAATFGTWDWAQIGSDILDGLSSGVSTVGTWVNDFLIAPMVDAFNSVDWAAVGDAILYGIGLGISAWTGWISFVTDNVLVPMFDTMKSVLGGIDWAQLGEDIIGFIFNPSDTAGNAGGVNWGGLFGQWMTAIADFGAAVFDFLGWTFENVISPLWQGMISGLAQVDWGSIWTTFLDLAGQALNVLWAGATWVYDNFLSPMLGAIGTAIQGIDWGQVWTTFLDLAGQALNMLWTAGTWVWDNFLSPMISSIGTSLAQVDWMQLGTDILNALGAGLLALWGAATWAYDNLIQPLLDNAQIAIETTDWFSVGQSIVFAIGDALKTAFDFVAWIIDSIFSPMTANAEGAADGIDWIGVGSSILSAIGNALISAFNFVQWLGDTIFAPLIAGAANAIGNFDWSSIGTNLMTAIANALPNIGQWVMDNIITPITNALAGFNPMAGFNTSTQMGGTGQPGLGTALAQGIPAQVSGMNNMGGGGSLGTGGFGTKGSVKGHAEGLNFVPQDMIALIHKGEAVIPASMNRFNPDSKTDGMGGGDININGDIIVQGASGYQQGLEAGRGAGDGIREKLRQQGGGRV
jgi:TP901 family phage tail tape measure protein